MTYFKVKLTFIQCEGLDVTHACNHSTKKAGGGELLGVQGQYEIHCEFQATLGYCVRLCFKITQKTRLSGIEAYSIITALMRLEGEGL